MDNGRLRSAFPKLQSSLRLARKLGLKDFEANILLSFGAYYYYIGDFREAERYLKESAKVAKEIDQLNTFAFANIALMRVYMDSGDLMKASELAEQVEKVVQKLMNEVIQIDFQLLTLELDFLLGKPVGLKKVSTIIEKCKTLGLQPRLADALVLAGRITARMEAIEKAREHFEKAIAILRKIGNVFYLARAYALYAEVLRYGGFKEESLLNYKKAYEIFKNLKTDAWTKVLSIPQPK
ncbi:MAG: tetratricopeptide repeat protein [candidate division WOR-3 bacterium]